MEIIATTALISINETLIVQLISFLVFLYFMNRIMFRPLLSTMRQRDEHIDRVKEDILSGKDNLTQLIQDMDKQRARAIREAEKVTSSFDVEADRRASELLEETREKINTLRHETEARVKDQIAQARQEIAGEVDAIALVIMEKMLHRRLST